MRCCRLCGAEKHIDQFVKMRRDCLECRAEVKKCATCNEVKPIEDFGVNRRHSDGREGRCRPCVATMYRNLPLYRERVKQRYASREAKDKRNARLKKRRQTDAEWAESEKLASRLQHHRGMHLSELLDRDGSVCYLCGKELDEKKEVDHVIPRKLGGCHELWNLRVTHAKCNRLKSERKIPDLDWVVPNAITIWNEALERHSKVLQGV